MGMMSSPLPFRDTSIYRQLGSEEKTAGQVKGIHIILDVTNFFTSKMKMGYPVSSRPSIVMESSLNPGGKHYTSSKTPGPRASDIHQDITDSSQFGENILQVLLFSGSISEEFRESRVKG